MNPEQNLKKKNYSRRKGEIMRKKEKERRDKEKVE